MTDAENETLPSDASAAEHSELESLDEMALAVPTPGEDVGEEPQEVDSIVAPSGASEGSEREFDVVAQLAELTSTVGRLSERIGADRDVIGRMQARIEALQGNQVRALLAPAVTELANLHAALGESAGRDYERLGFERVRKEFTLLADQLETAIDVLGAESIGAQVGDAFDSRMHQAMRRVPTTDPVLDATIAAIIRQGFTFEAEGKPALYARVAVYSYEAPFVSEEESNGTDAEPVVAETKAYAVSVADTAEQTTPPASDT